MDETEVTQEIEAPAQEVEESEATTEETVEVVEDVVEEPKPNKTQKRINKLTYDKKEAERTAEYWKNKAQEQVKAEPVGKPDRFDFDDEDQYLDARDEYNWQQRKEKEKADKQRAAIQEKQQEFRSSVQGMFNKGIEEFEDYAEVVIDNPALLVSDELVAAVTEMEHRDLVSYHLGKNTERAAEISAMTPYKQAIALKAIEDKLTAKASKKTTSAPPPIEPVGNNSEASVGAEPTNPDDWYKWRQEQLHRRRKG